MAEQNSVQGAKILAHQKLTPAESHGRQRILVATMPATHAQAAIADTVFLGRVPANSRFILGGAMSIAANGTASSTIDIGLRKTATQEVIDADGICAAASIATAGKVVIDTGALLTGATDYLTPCECDVYGTVGGAVLAANQLIRFEIPYVTD